MCHSQSFFWLLLPMQMPTEYPIRGSLNKWALNFHKTKGLDEDGCWSWFCDLKCQRQHHHNSLGFSPHGHKCCSNAFKSKARRREKQESFLPVRPCHLVRKGKLLPSRIPLVAHQPRLHAHPQANQQLRGLCTISLTQNSSHFLLEIKGSMHGKGGAGNCCWIPLVAQMVKRLPTMQETRVQSLSREDLPEKEMVTHSSILAWKIPRTEKPGRLQAMGSQRVGHD